MPGRESRTDVPCDGVEAVIGCGGVILISDSDVGTVDIQRDPEGGEEQGH